MVGQQIFCPSQVVRIHAARAFARVFHGSGRRPMVGTMKRKNTEEQNVTKCVTGKKETDVENHSQKGAKKNNGDVAAIRHDTHTHTHSS